MIKLKTIIIIMLSIGLFIPATFAFTSFKDNLNLIGNAMDFDVRSSSRSSSRSYSSRSSSSRSSYKSTPSRTTSTPKSTTTGIKAKTTAKSYTSRVNPSNSYFSGMGGFMLAYLIFHDSSHPDYANTMETLDGYCESLGYEDFKSMNNETQEIECISYEVEELQQSSNNNNIEGVEEVNGILILLLLFILGIIAVFIVFISKKEDYKF